MEIRGDSVSSRGGTVSTRNAAASTPGATSRHSAGFASGTPGAPVSDAVRDAPKRNLLGLATHLKGRDGQHKKREGEDSIMKRRTAFAIALATAMLSATGAFADYSGGDTQAPRGQELQSPRGQEIQAPRGHQPSDYSGNTDEQAPRG
jgi:hypothetical protein